MSLASRRQQTGQSNLATFEFTLLVSGVSEITDSLADAMYQAGCSDALFGVHNGQVYLDFSRESDSLIKAIVTAIQDVERAKIDGLTVTEVLPPDMPTIEMVNTFLEFRSQLSRKPGVFEDELLQLLTKAGPKRQP